MSDRDLAPRSHALGREEREAQYGFWRRSAWTEGGSCRYCKNGVGGGGGNGEGSLDVTRSLRNFPIKIVGKENKRSERTGKGGKEEGAGLLSNNECTSTAAAAGACFLFWEVHGVGKR